MRTTFLPKAKARGFAARLHSPSFLPGGPPKKDSPDAWLPASHGIRRHRAALEPNAGPAVNDGSALACARAQPDARLLQDPLGKARASPQAACHGPCEDRLAKV